VRGTHGRRLVDCYDLAMFDLDGVVYVGDRAVPGAADHLAALRSDRLHVAFVTNNASRSPAAVAQKLRDLGVEAAPGDVVTSAQAAAHVLLERFGADARVAVLGAGGLREALAEVGLAATVVDDPEAQALVSGFGPDVVWREVMQAAVRIRGGLPWVASNADLTFPSDLGLAPGHGALVELLSRFAGVEPTVAGKPRRPLLDETVRRVGGERPLMVGDRLDTDIEGAHAAGVDSLLVLTGVSGLAEVVSAPAHHRPTYLSPDLGGLLQPHPEPEPADGGWHCGGWTAGVRDGTLRLRGQGSVADWWRTVACASWAHLDVVGRVVDTGGVVPPDEGAAG
jgi:glycerol 3-phosphatase-2